MRAIIAALCVSALLACSSDDEGASLVVDVKTDLVPGIEFVAVRTALGDSERAFDLPAFRGVSFTEGQRAAEIDGLVPGELTAEVSLLDADMISVLSRRVRVDVRGPTGVTVVLARACSGVSCPGPGDDPSLTECVGGVCSAPTCTVESQETCPAAECTTDAACDFAASCAVGRCTDGSCLAESVADACGDDAYCDPELGCTPVEPPAPSCGPCGDGSEGVYEPTADEDLAGGLRQFESFHVPSGVTIRATGGQVLQIFSRGPVRIDGVLDLAGGEARSSAGCTPTPVGGGQGRAGGGDGGSSGTNGEMGQGPGGGSGGRLSMGGSGGGGGGSAEAGDEGAPSSGREGGAGGVTYAAISGATIAGGSGGGGGGDGTQAPGGGGSGGAGGGAVLIIAPEITIGAGGSIRAGGAAGGNGGGIGTTCDGGAGGGGSGGTVWLRAGTVTVDGVIDVSGGPGGRVGLGGGGVVPGAGGAGARGQLRIDAELVEGAAVPAHEPGPTTCDETVCAAAP